MNKLKKIILLFSYLPIMFLLSCNELKAANECPEKVWEKFYGGTDYDVCAASTKTTDGGYLFVGSTKSYGAGNYDGYFIKTDNNGNLLWSKTYGGAKDDTFYDVEQTQDGGFIAFGTSTSYGSARGKFYLVKTDSNGNMEWFKTYGHSDYTQGFGVEQTTDGGYILVGNSTQTDPWLDIRLTKVDGLGNEQWTKFFSRSLDDTGYDVKETSDGGYIITGFSGGWSSSVRIWVIKTDGSGNKTWDRTFGGSPDIWDRSYQVEELSDHSFVVVGNIYNAGNVDAALIKMDNTGNHIWTKLYGGVNNDFGRRFVELSTGGFMIAGYTDSFGEGSFDGYLIKTDNNGNEICSRTFGGTQQDYFNSILLLSDNDFILSGQSDSYGEGSFDVWISKVSSRTPYISIFIFSCVFFGFCGCVIVYIGIKIWIHK
ncbi:hypothetical protein [Anaerosacchariphilus polymeriproducens]|uniref:Lipoprotein n=1 Tax=Anaerosacchariphilus polymeriproducens TaxID=1812858 RepID=A0A371AWN1_9FIRM|nr:hypothetical protein [Anaerosacchariphilus polymeriproducens]RDU23994.1 hypothetical protein DWV06_06785 [Anaerosacchariphilus polymeriproducens]